MPPLFILELLDILKYTMAQTKAAARDESAQLAEIKMLFAQESLRGEFVYRTLREAIIRGVLVEGRRVQDRVLALELGVSRTPVREALQRLEAEGFLENTPRLGLVVAEITPQTIEDVFAIRIALEGVAARLAAQRASASDIEALGTLNEQIAHAVREGELGPALTLNHQFHLAIYRAARNAPLAELLNRLHYSVQRFRQSTLSISGRAPQMLEEHGRLVAAIRDHDADEAEQIARAHKERAMQARLTMYHRHAASR